jgi:precorrin-6B methylase 2
MRGLDVGAGAGSVTRTLAERVGSSGAVLAMDIDTTLLEGLASDRVDVRRLNLLSAAGSCVLPCLCPPAPDVSVAQTRGLGHLVNPALPGGWGGIHRCGLQPVEL